MKRIIFIIFVFACSLSTAKAEYVPEEMFVLPWGQDNDRQIPLIYDEHGDPWGPSGYFVDSNENIYVNTFYFGFRKYDRSGKLIYKTEEDIGDFAVDDSQNIYYSLKKPGKNHVIYTMSRSGESGNSFRFVVEHRGVSINRIKNIKGHIWVSGGAPKVGSQTAFISRDSLIIFKKKQYIPFNSDSAYFFTETQTSSYDALREAESYNQKFINIFKLDTDRNGEPKKEKLRIDNICRFPHTRSKVIGIDDQDHIYIRLYYTKELPVDIVVIDSAFREINRVEFPQPSQLIGLGISSFIRHDGTIYEFRDLDDGLHVIRWSRGE